MTNRMTDWFNDETLLSEALKIYGQLKFRSERLFTDFESIDRVRPEFLKRFAQWVSQAADDDDRISMFRLASDLYFVGRDEMRQLQEDVFQTTIAWWLIETFELQCIPRVEFQDLNRAVNSTWFTAVTDSLELARFHHVNGISGKNLRPEWNVLCQLGDPTRIAAYMEKEQLEAIVVMEDFVGSGTQVYAPLRFVLDSLPNTPALFAPLIVCEAGHVRLQELASTYTNLAYEPLVVLSASVTVSPVPVRGEPKRHAQYRELFANVRPLVGYRARQGFPLESDFGYAETGSLAVLYSNCPNNVPPLIHHERPPQWSALFPRTVRK